MKLWSSPASPFARKVMLLAHELGMADRIELVEAGTTPIKRNMELVADNPLGKLPALRLDDGEVLYDSAVICAWLDEAAGGRLIPASGQARWRCLTLESLADGMMDAAVLARYEVAMRPAEHRWTAWIDGQWAKIESALDTLEQRRIAELEGEVSLGQLGVAACLGYLDFRSPERDWRTGRPRLAAWFDAFSRRPSMVATHPHA